MSFALDLQRFAEKVGEKADDLVGGVVVRIAQELDRRSPVGDASYWQHPAPAGYIGGHFRANWQLGVNVRPMSEVAGVDTTGTVALPKIVAAIPDQASGKVFWIANNTPYGPRIEKGWSRQAPQGLVGITVTKFQDWVNEEAKKP